MYPPRSEKSKQNKLEKQRRQNRIWIMLNLTLITLILVLGAYLYLEERTQQGSPGTGTQQTPAGQDGDAGAGEQGDLGAGEVANQPPPADEASEPDTAANVPAGNGNSGGEEDIAASGNGTTAGEEELEPAVQPSDSRAASGNEADQLLIHFAGDTMFSGKVEEKLEKTGYDYPFEYVKELFQNDDLSVVNLETPVTADGEPAEDKTYVFKSPPKALGPMAKAGVDAVNLANNHILDQGVTGLKDTMKHLRQHHILFAGAGSSSKDAYAPVYLERKGIKIALCGFSRVIPAADWAAGKNKAGVAAVYAPESALNAIRTARKNADLVLVMVHWGKERTTNLESHQQELAHAFIDAGADLVIGGHPHVMQGLEKYKGKWIAYSTGNFIFTKSTDPQTWESAVFAAKCTRQGDCELQLIPYRTELGQPVPMSSEDGSKLLQAVESFSPGVRIAETGEVFSGVTEQADEAAVPLSGDEI